MDSPSIKTSLGPVGLDSNRCCLPWHREQGAMRLRGGPGVQAGPGRAFGQPLAPSIVMPAIVPFRRGRLDARATSSSDGGSQHPTLSCRLPVAPRPPVSVPPPTSNPKGGAQTYTVGAMTATHHNSLPTAPEHPPPEPRPPHGTPSHACPAVAWLRNRFQRGRPAPPSRHPRHPPAAPSPPVASRTRAPYSSPLHRHTAGHMAGASSQQSATRSR